MKKREERKGWGMFENFLFPLEGMGGINKKWGVLGCETNEFRLCALLCPLRHFGLIPLHRPAKPDE